jgi:hypothetical protein
MKGVIKTVVFIVVLIILLAVLVALLLQGQAILNLGTPEEILRYARLPDLTPTEKIGSVPAIKDYTGDRGDTTSTEVACGIAQSIKDDFLQNGYAERKASPDQGFPKILGKLDSNRQLVAARIFHIPINAITQDFWKYEDLSGLPLQTLKEECSDNSGELVPCPTPYLDEECVTALLSNLKQGDNFLCTGKIPAKVLAGGARQDFGNDNCGGDKKTASGSDDCKVMCPGADRLKSWTAPGDFGNPLPNYTNDIELDKSNEWPPKQCAGQNCSPSYMWLLLWDIKDKGYNIELGRLVDTADMGVQEPVSFVEMIVKPIMGSNDRKSWDPLRWGTADKVPRIHRKLTSGELYPELRSVWDVTFQPDHQLTFSQFVGMFERTIGSGWTANVEKQCVAEDDCLWQATDVAPVKWWRAKGRESGWLKYHPAGWVAGIGDIIEASDEYDQLSICSTKQKQLFVFNVRTNLAPEDNLLPNHKYRLVFNWWAITNEGSLGGPSCSNPTGQCVACIEPDKSGDPCTLNNRLARDCEKLIVFDPNTAPSNSYPAKEKAEVKRWQDLRVILIDEGETGPPPAEELVS